MPTEKHKEIRSSAAEYLTFIAANGDDQEAIEIRYEDENIWLTQKMMATLYDVSTAAINQHLKKYLMTMNCKKKQLLRIP
ncbi:conserved domain protein [Peptoniphilus sp. oral taxon 375 str. F0436]|nr:conserved domain protein [Peptoniphilus sp. oral taxon 375 str. F0436]